MNKVLSLLGLAKKAGRLAVGGEAVSGALYQNSARLVLTSADAAKNTLRRLTNYESVKHIRLPYSKEELGAALGFRSCAILAVCDAGFAKAFISAYDKQQNIEKTKQATIHTGVSKV